jgi:hypothetical protein
MAVLGASYPNSLTTAAAVLKEWYSKKGLARLDERKHPFLELISKREKEAVGGRYFVQPAKIGGTNTSGSLATAQGAALAVKSVAFQVTPASDYAVAYINGQTIAAAEQDPGQFVDMHSETIEDAIRAEKNAIARQLFRSATGSITTIGAISTGVITLGDPTATIHFQAGQPLTAHATDGAAARADLGYVISVDHAAGTITVSATDGGAAGSPTAWAANDFLCASGGVGTSIAGLQSWLPASAPAATSFFGVDRTVNSMLGGSRMDAATLGYSTEEAIQLGAAELHRMGGLPDLFVMNPISWQKFALGLGTRRVYSERVSEAGVGFRSIKVDGAAGPIDVISDPDCPGATGFLLDPSTLTLACLGTTEVPRVLDSDGLTLMRAASADAYELRVGHYSNLVCSAPGRNMRIALQS